MWINSINLRFNVKKYFINSKIISLFVLIPYKDIGSNMKENIINNSAAKW